MTLLITVILVALVFEYINGFHDTANSIATVVSTKVLTPRQAILLAAFTNLVGALIGHAVAKTVSSGLVDSQFVTNQTIVCALLGGIGWNLLTWWLGLPSSSTHALVGGLCGATLASADGNWKSILWSVEKFDAAKGVTKHEGVLHKVIIPMFTSPLIGFAVGMALMSLLYVLLRNARPAWVNSVFGKLQLASAGYMGFAHGLADAQKTMGIITLALVTATTAGTLEKRGIEHDEVVRSGRKGAKRGATESCRSNGLRRCGIAITHVITWNKPLLGSLHGVLKNRD